MIDNASNTGADQGSKDLIDIDFKIRLAHAYPQL